MANPTTNFGWVMPTSTSLVTNLPADFNTFGQAVDTSMSELLGGTTGQVLSKTSNTNMDFTWVTPTDQTPLTTKGDLFTFSTVDARLAVGTNGQTLVADSSTATGLKWATPSGGGKILQVVYGSTSSAVSSASSTYIDTNLTATITPTLATSTILVMVAQQVSKTATNSATSCNLRLYRGATNIRQLTTDLLYTATTLKFIGYTFVHNYVDSPATTSATTYKTMFMNPNSASQIELQDSGAFSTMVLMEIGA